METANNSWWSDETQLISFNLWESTYWVDIHKTLEIIRVPKITKTPRINKTPAWDMVEWMINLRGKAIPVLNLRRRFGLEDVEKTTNTKIVIMEVSWMILGLIIDQTPKIHRLPNDSLEAPTSVVSWWDDNCVALIWRMNETLIQILDVDKIIPEQMRNAIANSKRSK